MDNNIANNGNPEEEDQMDEDQEMMDESSWWQIKMYSSYLKEIFLT